MRATLDKLMIRRQDMPPSAMLSAVILDIYTRSQVRITAVGQKRLPERESHVQEMCLKEWPLDGI